MASRKYGDWEQLQSWLTRVQSKNYLVAFEKDLKMIGDTIAEKVKEHIRTQDLKWVPLSPVTVGKKGSSIIYIDSGDYLKKIKTKIYPKDDGTDLIVAVIGRHRSGMSMQEIAVALEYGTSKIPARPLWRPTFAEIKNLPEVKNVVQIGKSFKF